VPAGAWLDFTALRHETSPLMMASLLPGDWLYIPSRWWHLVHSVEDALSISIGIIPTQTSRARDLPKLAKSP
jgi:ribosomal protein L16 Arg81 hydroxylase